MKTEDMLAKNLVKLACGQPLTFMILIYIACLDIEITNWCDLLKKRIDELGK